MGRPKGSSAGSRWCARRARCRGTPPTLDQGAYPRAGLPSRVCPKTSRQLTTAPTLELERLPVEHRAYPGASRLPGTYPGAPPARRRAEIGNPPGNRALPVRPPCPE
ncbi:hypothetical protein E4U57_007273 [Claviceps arundinis]|uniref:Uncharacterized protein n=1 Tax=Claviceps arundinis TaxID=1623583 RepID=A0ABQ7P156_9HYPO|nr:hypothetical protein E4U57_007273 [Claviceps arundinis]